MYSRGPRAVFALVCDVPARVTSQVKVLLEEAQLIWVFMSAPLLEMTGLGRDSGRKSAHLIPDIFPSS